MLRGYLASSLVAGLLVLTLHAPRARAQVAGDEAVPRAVAATRGAVAVLRCGDARIGTAFAMGEDRLVTTWRAADCPRSVSVEGPDGHRVAARVIAADADHDLALVVAVGLGLDPLTLRDDALEIGERVVAIGFTGGAVGLVAHGGAVARVTPDGLRTDAAHPGIAGGPVLDAAGHVVGVVASMQDDGITRVAPVRWLESLTEGAAHDDVRSPVRLHGGVGVGVLVLDERALFLAEAHLSVDLWDELSLRAALQAAGGSTDAWEPQPLQRSESLYGGSVTLGYRFRIQVDDALALTITPELGAWVGLHTTSETTAHLGFADPGCDPSIGTCAITTRTETITREQWLARPTLTPAVGLGDLLELGYQLQLDVERPEASGHLVTLGVRL